MLVTVAKNRSWLVAAIPNTKYIMIYYRACNIYNDNRHNRHRRLTYATGDRGGGDNSEVTKSRPIGDDDIEFPID